MQRYFGVTSAGTGDGTSWANRAALYDGGWSSIITGHDFTLDGLQCFIEQGTYDVGSLSDGSFTNPPNRRPNQLYFIACYSDGTVWQPPDPSWKSCQPVWDMTDMAYIRLPVGSVFTVTEHVFYGCRLEGGAIQGVFGAVTQTGWAVWCYIHATHPNGGSSMVTYRGYATNSVIKCDALAYMSVMQTLSNTYVSNVRAEGNPLATSQLRACFYDGGNGRKNMIGCTAVDTPGNGFDYPHFTGDQNVATFDRCSAINCGGDGINVLGPNVALAWTNSFDRCLIVNCGGYGISVGTAPALITGGRFRNNTSGNFNNTLYDPIDAVVSAGTDADEFVNPATGDYRIKNTSSIWGLNVGPGDELPAAGSGSGGTRTYWG